MKKTESTMSHNNGFIDNIIRYYLVLVDFILPIPLTVLAYYIWMQRTDHMGYVISLILLAIVYGYVVPEIATRFLRLWEFTWPFRINYCYVHHGFIYSGYLPFILLISWNPANSLDFWPVFNTGILSFLIMSFVGVHHDMFGFRVGMIINHTMKLKPGESHFKYISLIGAFCYGLVGLFYSMACIFSYSHIVIKGNNSVLDYALWLIISLLVMTQILLPYSLSHIDYIKTVFHNRKDNIDKSP